MFTGIVEGLGEIVSKNPIVKGIRFVIKAPFDLSDVKLGDSISVNGVCLTVINLEIQTFAVEVSPETLMRTTLGGLQVGTKVNLERALQIGDRLGGHLVSGHVDGIGEVISRKESGDFLFFTIKVPENLTKYIIEKGSIAVDGISLTINAISQNLVELAIIPHTARITTMGFRRPGDLVNIEVDLIGKYIERLLQPYLRPKDSITLEFLKEHGFL